MLTKKKNFVSTRNPCKMCTPLGAVAVFKGIKNAVTLMHGSQGCSTYIRRYYINHFKEPVDIASSNFSESTAIFGGQENLFTALLNVEKQYHPELIGIMTTCLSETIGDDMNMLMHEFKKIPKPENFPEVVNVSTASYRGTHMDGFYAAVLNTVKYFAQSTEKENRIALFSGFVSPEDIRHMKEIMGDFKMPYTLLPDYSETFDGSSWNEYERIPQGGTAIADIRNLGGCSSILEFGDSLADHDSAGKFLNSKFKTPNYQMGFPIGVKRCDEFFNLLEKISGRSLPEKYKKQRGRLIDSYSDAHKYVFEKRAILYGEEDFVISMAAFLLEIGIIPAVCGSGAKSGTLKKMIPILAEKYNYDIDVREGVDFMDLQDEAEEIRPDIIIGNSKGYSLARKLNIPLVRVGFPIHDRIGGARIQHLGYEGTQQLFDRIVNTLIERKQDQSPVGYSYM